MRTDSRAQSEGRPSFLRPALFAFFSFLLIAQVSICVEGLRLGSDGRADFRQLYVAGHLIRSKQRSRLYDFSYQTSLQDRLVGVGPSLPFNRLPVEAVLFAPLSLCPYRVAYFLFAAINTVLLGLTSRTFRHLFPHLRDLCFCMPEAIVFCFLPAAIALCLGQDSIVLLAIVTATFVSLKRGNELRAGLLLSLGMFKFQVILPIVLLFLLWRQFRFVLGVASGALCWLVASIALVGLAGLRGLMRMILAMSVELSGHGNEVHYSTFPAQMPNLRGLLCTLAGKHLPATATQIAILLSSLVVIWIASRRQPSLPLSVLVAVLVSYHGLVHDSLILVLPLTGWLSQAALIKAWRIFGLAFVVFVFPLIAFASLHNAFWLEAPLLLVLMGASGQLPDQPLHPASSMGATS